MGYTHYWSFDKTKLPATDAEALYTKAIKECQRIAVEYNKNAIGCDRLSGYAAHCKPGTYGGIKLNGKQDNAHEDFVLPEHFSDNFRPEFGGGGFCKTARKPYDLVVVACLAVLKYRLGDAIQVSSDGGIADWAEGILWARCVLKRAIPNPLKVTNDTKLRGIK